MWKFICDKFWSHYFFVFNQISSLLALIQYLKVAIGGVKPSSLVKVWRFSKFLGHLKYSEYILRGLC